MSARLKLEKLVSKQAIEHIDTWIAKYPPDYKCSAVMAALKIVQDEHLFLTQELMDGVAEYLEMEPISVYEVATFYSMYELKPVGKHKLCVCTNISCMLRGSEQIVAHLEKKLNIRPGQTTTDKLFTLKEVECLGACCGAPMMQVGEKYYENLTPSALDELIESLRQQTKGNKTIEASAS